MRIAIGFLFLLLFVGCLTASDAENVGEKSLSGGSLCEETCGTHSNKYLICHVPSDNTGNAHTLCVGSNLVPDHLRHGDSCGSCPDEGPVCGDEFCSIYEDCSSCPTDCGTCPPDRPDRLDGGVPANQEPPSSQDASPPPEETNVSGGRFFGCSSGGQGGPALAFIVLVLLYLATKRRNKVKRLLPFLAFLFASFFCLTAQAQTVEGEPSNFRLERFDTSMDASGIINVEAAEIDPMDSWGLSFWTGYANDPLVLNKVTADGKQRVDSLVNDQLSASLGAYYVYIPDWVLGIEMPFTVLQGRYNKDLDKIASAGLGDLRLRSKIQLVRQEERGVNLVFGVDLRFPTSRGSRFADAYMGEKDMVFAPYLAFSRQAKAGLRYAANLGFRARPRVNIGDLVVDDEAFLRLGVAQKISRRGELGFSVNVNSSTDKLLSPVNTTYGETMASYSYSRDDGWQAYIGAGYGFIPGFGAPDWRAFVGLRYTVKSQKPKVWTPPPVTEKEVVKKDSPPKHKEPKVEVYKVRKPIVTIPTTYFEYNKAVIKLRYKKLLVDLGKTLAAVFEYYPGLQMNLVIEGHTDAIGTKKYNKKLGKRRAKAVRDTLSIGIPADKVKIVSRGELDPIAANKTAAGRARNRRVELYLVGDVSKIKLDFLSMLPGTDTYDNLGNR